MSGVDTAEQLISLTAIRYALPAEVLTGSAGHDINDIGKRTVVKHGPASRTDNERHHRLAFSYSFTTSIHLGMSK